MISFKIMIGIFLLSSVTDKDIGNNILAIPLPIHDQDDELI
jgi:hypothetical protein